MDSLTQIALGASIGVAVMGRRTAAWKAALWGGVAGFECVNRCCQRVVLSVCKVCSCHRVHYVLTVLECFGVVSLNTTFSYVVPS